MSADSAPPGPEVETEASADVPMPTLVQIEDRRPPAYPGAPSATRYVHCDGFERVVGRWYACLHADGCGSMHADPTSGAVRELVRRGEYEWWDLVPYGLTDASSDALRAYLAACSDGADETLRTKRAPRRARGETAPLAHTVDLAGTHACAPAGEGAPESDTDHQLEFRPAGAPSP